MSDDPNAGTPAFMPSAPDNTPAPAAGAAPGGLPDIQNPSSYHVVHRPTGQVVGKASTVKRARSIREKKDLEYGGAAHTIRPVNAAGQRVNLRGERW
jgi:hypothetical protein